MKNDLIRGAISQLGRHGVFGVVILLLMMVFNALALAPLENANAIMHARIDAARKEAEQTDGMFRLTAESRRVTGFFRALPDGSEIGGVMSAIYGKAAKYGVRINEGAYHLEEKDELHDEYVMDFPVRGEYRQIRLFASHLLADMPYLALDQIDFRRDRVSEAMLLANVRLRVFLRHPPSHAR